MVKARPRETGAVAKSAPHGAVVATPTGGRMDVVTQPSAAGFSPLDMIYASLASCLVISLKAAAARQGVLDRYSGATVSVTGEKAHDEPSRVIRFDVVFDIRGDLTAAERHALMEAAEGEICTISNTLQGNPTVSGRLIEE